MEKVKCKVAKCECGRLSVCQEDEDNHCRVTGHRIREKNWCEDASDLSRMVGIQILAHERGYIFAEAQV